MQPIDPQDPLPEPTWLWRRLYVYGVSIVFLGLVSLAVDKMARIAVENPEPGISALLTTIQWLLAALICVLTYYLVAPSAEQIVKLIQAARLQRTKVEAEHPKTTQAATKITLPEPPRGGSSGERPARKQPPENPPWP